MRDQTHAVHEALRGDDEVRGGPPDERPHGVGQEQEEPGARQDPPQYRLRAAVSVDVREREDLRDYEHYRHEDRADQGDPVGTGVHHDLLPLGQQPGREWHVSRTLAAASGRDKAQRRWTMSPNPTVARPPTVCTTRLPPRSTSSAVPSTTLPSAIVACTRLPSVAESGAYAATTACANPSAPGAEIHARPSLPRPPVWCSAATSVHSGSPFAARSIAVVFVDSVTSS